MKNILGTILLLAVCSSFASDCPSLYPNSHAIEIPKTQELCNSFYVVVYDLKKKSPLFSSALVYPDNNTTVKRTNDFRPDTRLNYGQRGELSDYRNSDFDRGHLTPAGDANTDEEMEDTFLLSNIVPQYPYFNRGIWKKIEAHVRRNLTQYTIVVTGVILEEKPKTIGTTKIPIPIGMYKIVYWNKRPTIFYSENSNNPQVREISFDKLEELSGIKFPKTIDN